MIFERLKRALEAAEPAALVTRLDGPERGAKMLVFEAECVGSLGAPAYDAAAAVGARHLLASDTTATRTVLDATNNEVTRVFVQSFLPSAAMYIFGAVDFSRAMARMGKFLGFRVWVIDARPVFATPQRMPDADEVIVAWPDEFLRSARVDARTAIVVLTHDLKFDIPLLRVALETRAGYIGVMGSRRTHESRLNALRDFGLPDDALTRICGPIGLDIGAHTPEETAVSIAAEIIALRTGHAGGRLTGGTTPIHSTLTDRSTGNRAHAP